MNMQVLKKTRIIPDPGDIFVYRLAGRDYGFGRVIRAGAVYRSANGEPIENTALVYFYDAFSPDKATVPALSRTRLLLTPHIIDRTGPWRHGHFETVARRPLVASDVLPVHCFVYRPDGRRKCYVNEDGMELIGIVQAIAEAYGITSGPLVDYALSLALGVPVDPSTDPHTVAPQWQDPSWATAPFHRAARSILPDRFSEA